MGHRREGDDARVLHLAEVAFDNLPGAGVGDHLVRRGLLEGLVGKEDPLAEDLLLERVAGVLVDVEGEAKLCGLLAGERRRHHPGDPAWREDRLDLLLHLLAGLSRLAKGEACLHPGELTVGLGEGLVKAAGLLGMQLVGVAEDEAALGAEDDLFGLERDEAGGGLLVDDPVAVLLDSEEVGVIRGRQRADKGERRAVESLVVLV